MRLIRVFPRRTMMTPDDDMAFVGEPPLMRPPADEVHVSVTFTHDIEYGQHLFQAWSQYYRNVKIGGPAMGSPYTGFTPGVYVKNGVTFTSIGCPNRCPPCLVWKRQRAQIEYDPVPEGWIVQDDNFSSCTKAHRMATYRMLEKQSHAAEFRGGIEPARVTDELAAEFRSIRIKNVFLACDHDGERDALKRAVDKLSFLGRDKLYCYALCAEHGQSFGDMLRDRRRIGFIWNAGCIPYAQLYQPPERYIKYSQTWRHFQRDFSRPAISKSILGSKHEELN